MLLKYSLPALSFAALTSATFFGNCAPLDVCILALRGGLIFSPRLQEAAKDCRENLAPDTVTQTKTILFTRSFTSTLSTTSTSRITNTITSVVPRTRTSDVYVTPTSTVSKPLFPDGNLKKRHLPIFDRPLYALPCLNMERYESACSCIGVTAPTATPTAFVTVTKTVSYTTVKTVSSSTLIQMKTTKIETSFISTVTKSYTTTTATLTVRGPFKIMAVAPDDTESYLLTRLDVGTWFGGDTTFTNNFADADVFYLYDDQLRTGISVMMSANEGYDFVSPIPQDRPMNPWLEGSIGPLSCAVPDESGELKCSIGPANMWGFISENLGISDTDFFFISNGGYVLDLFAVPVQQAALAPFIAKAVSADGSEKYAKIADAPDSPFLRWATFNGDESTADQITLDGDRLKIGNSVLYLGPAGGAAAAALIPVSETQDLSTAPWNLLTPVTCHIDMESTKLACIGGTMTVWTVCNAELNLWCLGDGSNAEVMSKKFDVFALPQ